MEKLVPESFYEKIKIEHISESTVSNVIKFIFMSKSRSTKLY